EHSHGLLSDLGAMSLVAQGLLVTQEGLTGLDDQKINSVHAGLNDVTVSGEIVDLSELREFPRQDGTTGRIIRLRIQDVSGVIGVAAWDIHADLLVQKLARVGGRIRIEHGYTKHGRAGEVELHLGNKARIQLFDAVTPARTGDEDLPWATISQVAKTMGPNACRLRVFLRHVHGQQTPNGPATALCEDETGLGIVKFWDDKADEASRMQEKKWVIIGNPTVAERNGTIYLNIGRNSLLQEDNETSKWSGSQASIGTLKPGPTLYTLSGLIVDREYPREVETKEGRKVRVASIRLEDKTGRLRVSLWDHHADKVESLSPGTTIKLIGVKVREGFNREVEASSVFLTEIENPFIE
ncbi:MAG TPA: hypothetical protein VE177_07485, partial [Candidatus Binatus sp.]|nr:hypothetical protein [Candidatus Binatus sp.]